MSAGRREVVAALESIGERNTASAIADKCSSICLQHGLKPSELVNHWESYAVNNGLSSVTLDALESLGLSLSKAAVASARKAASRLVTPKAPERAPLLKKEDLSQHMSPPAPITGVKRPGDFPSPPEREVSAKTEERASPTSVQSPPDPVATYEQRKNAGEIVARHNQQLGLATGAMSASGRPRVGLSLTPEVGMHSRYRHMFTPIEERSLALETGLLSLQAEMEERADLPAVSPAAAPSQEEVTLVGRVCCEAAEGKMNKLSILLEGSRRDSGGRRVHLDLRHSPSFALFPGQVVAARGMNPAGGTLVVAGLLEGARRPLPATKPSELLRLQYDKELGGGAPVVILAAAGPFTTADNLEFRPLVDLLQVVRAVKPDVVVLMGPFVDEAHPQVSGGKVALELDDGSREPVDFETLFKLRVSGALAELLEEGDDELPTQFVLVPSTRDVFHDCVYPQPPLADRIARGMPLSHDSEDRVYNLELPRSAGHLRRVHCIGNPAMFMINEVVIGVSSEDVLFDLTCEEISSNVGQNRLARLTDHLLLQQSFYPLYPPPATGPNSTALPLDLRHAPKWRMPMTPDILLLPSKLAHFTREVGGCLCINPGHLAKGGGGGTFGRLVVHPMPKDKLQAAVAGTVALNVEEDTAGTHGMDVAAAPAAPEPEADVPMEHDVAARTRVEVLRI